MTITLTLQPWHALVALLMVGVVIVWRESDKPVPSFLVGFFGAMLIGATLGALIGRALP